MVTRKSSTKDRARQSASGNPEGSTVDPNALVQWVLRESYLQATEDLRYYAEKVKYFNQQKKAIREYLQALSCVKSKFLAAAHERRLDTARPGADQAKQLARLLAELAHAFEIGPIEAELGLPARVPAEKVDSLDAFADEIAKWEEKLATLGDDAQLANVDLQNMLQKQQQTLQMMSNISKMLYDTAQSIIRKMGG